MKHLVAAVVFLIPLSGVCWAKGNVELKTEAGKINYSVGYQIGGDFKSQGVELDPEALVQGIHDALGNTAPLLTREQMDTLLRALKKKIETAKVSNLPSDAEYRRASDRYLKENAKKSGVTVLENGVQYTVLKAGSDKKPALNDDVTVQYRITRVDGREIGSTYGGKKPRTFKVAKAFPALRQVLQLMGEGAKWRIVFPTTTATGGRESLEGKGAVIYELDLLSIGKAK